MRHVRRHEGSDGKELGDAVDESTPSQKPCPDDDGIFSVFRKRGTYKIVVKRSGKTRSSLRV